jgi:hypothetical protein
MRQGGSMMRESTRPMLAGLLVGVILSVGASYLLRGILYGVNIVDGISFVGVSFLFLAIALFATYLPSRRAMRVDPIVAPAPGDLLQELESFWLSHANTSIHSATYDASTPAHGSSRKRAFACAEM